MTPQERDVIAGIFDRLRPAASQPRDPEAERFITDRLREQPYAVYAMAQSVYVQEQALTNLQAQVEQLQSQVQHLQNQPAAPAQSGGFLSGIFGGGSSAPARAGSVPSFPQRGGPQPASPAWGGAQPGSQGMAPQQGMAPGQAAGPWQGQQPQQPPARGGGFMATALTTAAGVAGGMVAGNMLMNAFSGNKGGEAKAAEANGDQGAKPAADAQTAADQPYEDPANSYQEPNPQEANYQDASNESYDDGSSSFGGGGDDEWA